MYLGSRFRGMSRFRNGATGVDLRTLLWPTGTEAGMWLDPSDASTAFQDSAGTTAGAIDSPVGKRVSKAGNLSAVLQATATARPVWKSVSGIYSDLFDGTDDGYGTATFAAGTLTNNMDCFIAVNYATTAPQILLGQAAGDGTTFVGARQVANSASTALGVGTGFSIFVNGVAVADNRDTLSSALGSAQWCVLEYRNLNLSAWVGVCVGLPVSAQKLNANEGGLILCPAQSDATRAIVRRELGRKVGLSL